MVHNNGRAVGEQNNLEQETVSHKPGESEVERNNCRDHIDVILGKVLHNQNLYATDYKEEQCNTGPKLISTSLNTESLWLDLARNTESEYYEGFLLYSAEMRKAVGLSGCFFVSADAGQTCLPFNYFV